MTRRRTGRAFARQRLTRKPAADSRLAPAIFVPAVIGVILAAAVLPWQDIRGSRPTARG